MELVQPSHNPVTTILSSGHVWVGPVQDLAILSSGRVWVGPVQFESSSILNHFDLFSSVGGGPVSKSSVKCLSIFIQDLNT